MRRWFVVIPEKAFVSELLPLALIDMDALLDAPRTHNIIGIPAYYDVDDRVWPIPHDGCIITKTDN